MYDLMGHLTASKYVPYWNGSQLEFYEQWRPTRGQTVTLAEERLGQKEWRLYGEETGVNEDFYLSADPQAGTDYTRVNAADTTGVGEESSQKLFLSTVSPFNDPATSGWQSTHRSLTVRQFARPVNDSLQPPLHISGWLRTNSVDPNSSNNGAKLTFSDEDNNAKYYAYLLSTDGNGTPNALRIFKEDRTGGTEPTFGTTIGVSSTFTTWEFHFRYRFDIIMRANDIRIWINNSTESAPDLTVVDGDIRNGSLGWRMDNTHADFGDLVVSGGINT